jgi:hypothetical protein
MSSLAAMAEGEGVCPICGQPNFECNFNLFDIFSGDEVNVDGLENAHIECLKEQGLERLTGKTQNSENELAAKITLSSVAAIGAYMSIYSAQLAGMISDEYRMRNYLDVVFYLHTLCILVPVGIYAKSNVKPICNKIKEFFSKLFEKFVLPVSEICSDSALSDFSLKTDI